jgi:hypothetical protein
MNEAPISNKFILGFGLVVGAIFLSLMQDTGLAIITGISGGFILILEMIKKYF